VEIGLALFGQILPRRVLLEWQPAIVLRWRRRAMHMLRRTQVRLMRRIGSSTRFKCISSAEHFIFLDLLRGLHLSVSIMRKYTQHQIGRPI
jgi:hypothetical protein